LERWRRVSLWRGQGPGEVPLGAVADGVGERAEVHRGERFGAQQLPHHDEGEPRCPHVETVPRPVVGASAATVIVGLDST